MTDSAVLNPAGSASVVTKPLKVRIQEVPLTFSFNTAQGNCWKKKLKRGHIRAAFSPRTQLKYGEGIDLFLCLYQDGGFPAELVFIHPDEFDSMEPQIMEAYASADDLVKWQQRLLDSMEQE